MSNFFLKSRIIMPKLFKKVLWGDRERWGLIIKEEDPCWKEWQNKYSDFYIQNQREGIGTYVNDAGYAIMNDINLDGKRVLEIGAGDIRHIKYWSGNPAQYILADTSDSMMDFAKKRLADKDISYKTLKVTRNKPLPVDDESIDVIISFYSLEHIYPLGPFLDEASRLLKPNGIIIGAVPTEGGLAWGLGRFLTSRRWFRKHTTIDPDKIICWEHPNFADEIFHALNNKFKAQKIRCWPIPWISILDINLVIRFIYKKI
jgi:SAM-dependent methyltransferase